MKEFLTVMFAEQGGVTLQTARRLTDSEKAKYRPESQDYMMVSTGNNVQLPNLTWMDLVNVIGSQSIDGQFPGSGNRVYIITKDQWDALIAMDRGIASDSAEQARADEIAELEGAKASAEKQMVSGRLPTKEEAKKKAREYNNVHNEGGYGYVPHYYSGEEYRRICARLSDLKGGN